jgi:hypothetical protein
MYTISVRFRPSMKVNIYNRCSDFKLTYRGSFIKGAHFNEKPDQEVDTGCVKSLNVTTFLAAFRGVLMHKLERKYVKPGSQHEPTDIILLVIWKSERYKEFRAFVQLIERNNTSYWSEIQAEEYYRRYENQLCTCTDSVGDTWLIHDGTVLTTKLGLHFKRRDGVLNIVISEGIKDKHARKPEWIDVER